MAATLTQERFTGAGLDVRAKVRRHSAHRVQAGRRRSPLLAHAKGEGRSRASPPPSRRFRSPTSILDGEVTWDGHTAYHVFDVIWIDGRDVTRLPLTERRAAARRAAARARRCIASASSTMPRRGSARAGRDGRA